MHGLPGILNLNSDSEFLDRARQFEHCMRLALGLTKEQTTTLHCL